MKLSLSWIFDYINGDWHDYDVHDLVQKIIMTTAEIEHVTQCSPAWDSYALARVASIEGQEIRLECAEWKKNATLAFRDDVKKGSFVLVSRDGKEYRWGTLSDLGAEKDGLVPVIVCSEKEALGAWRDTVDRDDYIFEIDNKSLTNRPDLWGHRGFAREVAAILGLSLRADSVFFADKPIKHYATKTDAKAEYTIDISEPSACKRFAGVTIDRVSAQGSLLWMVARLARLNTRSRDAFVDMTNYVLFDIGHPMHAFDAACIDKKTIIARQALSGEMLVLLDDQKIELTPEDCVIADAHRPLSLAGIMGGLDSAVTSKTTSIFLEAAYFEPVAIRKSAFRHKVRTESAMRFEKGLDPNQNTTALLRYLKLFEDAKIPGAVADAIHSVGTLVKEKVVEFERLWAESLLGTTITVRQVNEILKKLGFGVEEKDGVFRVTVPTSRSSKDISCAEDIVEEIGRFVGYESIVPSLPSRVMKPLDHRFVYFERAIKQHCAYAIKMHEVSNYALYDEDFLHELQLNPQDCLELQNPLSEHWKRLVTSLVPHLLKNVAENQVDAERMRFFEWARAWQMVSKKDFVEQMRCAGIFYDRQAPLDFYVCKAELQSLFDMLNVSVTWRRCASKQAVAPWLDPSQSAELCIGDVVIGYAGMVESSICSRVADGAAWVFEFDCQALFEADRIACCYQAPSKYPVTTLDISMLAPYAVTVAQLEESIVLADARIKDVYLFDVFEKDEWGDKRSITIRYLVQDDEKTMTKQDITAVQDAVQRAVKKHKVEVR